MREKLMADMKEAMKSGNKAKLSTLRMVLAALKDKDIEARVSGKVQGDDEIIALLRKMVKSRQESRALYAQAGRTDLVEQEAGEIAILESYLPQMMDDATLEAAVRDAMAQTGAATVKDMGKVLALLKQKHGAVFEAATASAKVKAMLG